MGKSSETHMEIIGKVKGILSQPQHAPRSKAFSYNLKGTKRAKQETHNIFTPPAPATDYYQLFPNTYQWLLKFKSKEFDLFGK